MNVGNLRIPLPITRNVVGWRDVIDHRGVGGKTGPVTLTVMPIFTGTTSGK